MTPLNFVREGGLTEVELARLTLSISKLSLTKEESERLVLLAGIFSKVGAGTRVLSGDRG